MAVSVGSAQLGGDLLAVDRRRPDPEGIQERRDVEAAEVEDLQHVRSAEQPFEVGGAGLSRRDLDEVRVSVARGQLHHAEPVAVRVQPHGLAVDRDRRPEVEAVRKIAGVQMIGHALVSPGWGWTPKVRQGKRIAAIVAPHNPGSRLEGARLLSP